MLSFYTENNVLKYWLNFHSKVFENIVKYNSFDLSIQFSCRSCVFAVISAFSACSHFSYLSMTSHLWTLWTCLTLKKYYHNYSILKKCKGSPVCPRSLGLFYIVTYYTEYAKTSWTNNIKRNEKIKISYIFFILYPNRNIFI